MEGMLFALFVLMVVVLVGAAWCWSNQKPVVVSCTATVLAALLYFGTMVGIMKHTENRYHQPTVTETR